MRALHGLARVMVAAACLLASACGGDEAESGPLGIADGAKEGASTSVRLGAGQQATLSLDTRARLFIPAGALASEAEVRLARLPDDEALRLAATLPSQFQLASAPYLLTPHGTAFSRPVELKLPVARVEQTSISVAWLENEQDTEWKILDRPEISDGDARVELTHFSVVALVADWNPPVAAAQAVIGAEGGSVELVTARGIARLTIPPSVLSAPRRFRIEQLPSAAIQNYNEFAPDPLFSFLPHGTVFSMPITLAYPASDGATVALRRRSGIEWIDNRWEPVRTGEIASGTAQVQTVGLGLFASGTMAQAERVAEPCEIVKPLEEAGACGFTGHCFAKSRAISVRCSADGTCECTGGAAGRATFTGSCGAGSASLMQAAAVACEWSPERPNVLPSSSWWQVVPEPVGSCSTQLKLVGGYVWTGPENPMTGLPAFLFDGLSWHATPRALSRTLLEGGALDVTAASDGLVTDFLFDCVHLRRAPDAPCHTPTGLVQGMATKLALEFVTSASNAEQVSERLQFMGNAVVDPAQGSAAWMVHCWSVGSGPEDGPFCECHAPAATQPVPWRGSTAAGLAAVRRFAQLEATAEDGAVLREGCTWPAGLQFELNVRSIAPLGPVSGYAPLCLAP